MQWYRCAAWVCWCVCVFVCVDAAVTALTVWRLTRLRMTSHLFQFTLTWCCDPGLNGPRSPRWLTQCCHDRLTGLRRCCMFAVEPSPTWAGVGVEWSLLPVVHAASPLQSAEGEWKGTCRDGRHYVSQLTLLHHLIMWNNFSQCPALISVCGNSSFVPNCGARRAQAEDLSEKKGNNWICPLPYTCLYIVYVFEGVCLIILRHFRFFIL